MALDVYFIRHAQSEGNLGLKTASHEGIVLSEHGHAQAQAVADSITRPPSIIAMSPMVRAIQTSEPLKRKFPQVPTEILPIHEFTYLSSDKWNGTTSAERKPAINQYWQHADPYYKDSAESESFADLIRRADLIPQSVEYGSFYGRVMNAKNIQARSARVAR